MASWFLLFLLLLAPVGGRSEEAARRPWTMDDVYDGPHTASFNKIRIDVPIFIRQTMIDMAVRCGLNFEEGWQVPLVVRFVDGSPMGVENVLAYVQMVSDEKGNLAQTLNINLAAYDANPFNFRKVFAHELVHAMINDGLGRDGIDMPVWFHEGLAVYGAEQGPQMMEAYVNQYPNAEPDEFLNGLEGPHGALDYLEDYLAFQYIRDQHGVNSLQGFIRAVVGQKKPIPQAIQETCFESWDRFQENAKKFAESKIFDTGRSQHSRERLTKPY